MSIEKPKEAKSDRLRSQVLSDILRAELGDNPVNWLRYQADHPNRMKVIEDLYQSRYISLTDNRCFLTFNGLVLLKTKEAKALLADCQKVFNFMMAHYRRDLHKLIPLLDVTRQIKLSPERTVSVIRFLNRDSGVQIGVERQPLTVNSSVNASDSFLRERSFRKMIKKTRDALARSVFPVQSPLNLFPLEPTAELCADALQRLGSAEVMDAWEKCNERVARDSAGAITAAKSLAESACKQVLDRRRVSYAKSIDLPGLYTLATKEMQLDPGQEANEALRKILGGCATIVNGLAQLRNTHGDSHGKAPGSGQPSQRHARLAVSLAGTMAAFLLSTDDGRERP